ncbi:MAG: hypothetical protein MZV70_54360 [Desulfobacterales bacterium]|nr:hypothetical protein [Desulfobacterales bacterium]
MGELPRQVHWSGRRGSRKLRRRKGRGAIRPGKGRAREVCRGGPRCRRPGGCRGVHRGHRYTSDFLRQPS